MKKSIFKRWWFWVIVVFIGLIVLVNLGGDGNTDVSASASAATVNETAASIEATEAQEVETATPKPTTTIASLAVGDSVQTEKFKLTVVDAKKVKASEYVKPSSGNVFYRIDVLIENTSDEELNISSALMFDAYVDDMEMIESYELSLLDDKAKTVDGTIAAGKKLSGTLFYEVSKDWKVIEIQMDPTAFDWFNSEEKVIIKINK